MRQIIIYAAFTVFDIVSVLVMLHWQRKRFLKFLRSENTRLTTEAIAAQGKAYQDGAKAMATAMQKKLEEIKRVETSIPFVVATGNELENKQRLSVAGIHWEHYKDNKVVLLQDHNWTLQPIGVAYPFVDKGVLKAVINFREGLENIEQYGDMHPSIGGVSEETVIEDGITVSTKFSLHEISLHLLPNQDPTIKTLNEQIKNK